MGVPIGLTTIHPHQPIGKFYGYGDHCGGFTNCLLPSPSHSTHLRIPGQPTIQYHSTSHSATGALGPIHSWRRRRRPPLHPCKNMWQHPTIQYHSTGALGTILNPLHPSKNLLDTDDNHPHSVVHWLWYTAIHSSCTFRLFSTGGDGTQTFILASLGLTGAPFIPGGGNPTRVCKPRASSEESVLKRVSCVLKRAPEEARREPGDEARKHGEDSIAEVQHS